MAKRTKQRRKAPKKKMILARRPTLPESALRWRELLRDPCNGKLVHSCFAGSQSAYIIRTVDVVTPNITLVGATPGAQIRTDFWMEFRPRQYSATTGLVSMGGLSGVLNPGVVTSGFPTNFITNRNVVKRYRPIAGCVRWIPTGKVMDRSGVIGMSLSPSLNYATDTTVSTIPSMLATAQKVTPNGAAPHEVRFLPVAQDEEFTNNAASTSADGTAIICVGQNISGVATSATLGSPDGYFEVTWVWEWIPIAINGVPLSAALPNPVPAQTVLGSIGDFSRWVFEGVDTQRLAAGAVNYMVRHLTSGYQPTLDRSRPQLTWRTEL